MARSHGSKAVLFMDDQAGACINVSGDLNNITFNRGRNEPETTTFGDVAVQREVKGLMDCSLDVTAIFNSSACATTITGLLDELYAGSLHSRVQYCPGGSVSGCPIFTGCMRLTSLAYNQPVDNLLTTNFTLALAEGCMAQACQA